MASNRNWDYERLQIENSINQSKQTIKIFERSIINAQEKNEASIVKIEELEKQFEVLNNDFFAMNGIYFDQAQEYVDNSDNPSRDFNLQEFNRIKNIQDKICGEKFMIHQREQQIAKHNKSIEDLNELIQMQQQRLG